MDPPTQPLRFRLYELLPKSQRLFKQGVRVRLRPKPFLLLQVLLERSGEVVTREELQRCLWPSDTFVDFEHGLNTAVKELRAVLGDSSAEPKYIETLPRVGYRFLVPVERTAPVAAPAAIREADEAALPVAPKEAASLTAMTEPALGRERKSGIPRWAAAVAALLVVSALVFTGYRRWGTQRGQPHPVAGRVMLAVLPFENLTGDNAQEYFSDGLTEEMISRLAQIDPGQLGVVARTSVMHYKNTHQSLPQIGQELGVQYVLEGSVRRDTDKVRISAQLIQLKDQTHVWSRQYDRELGSLLEVESEIAQEIVDELKLTLGRAPAQPATQPVSRANAMSYEAYDLYLRGRYYWNRRTAEGFKQSARYFQRAIEKDPGYAPAYAGLADTYALMGTWHLLSPNESMPKARAATLKALQIDKDLAEAHTSLALIAEMYDYDWGTAEKEYQRAIQLDPGYATAHQWYAECLSYEGRFDQALAESERARQLDLSP